MPAFCGALLRSADAAYDPEEELATELHNSSLDDAHRPVLTLDWGQALTAAHLHGRRQLRRVARRERVERDPVDAAAQWPPLTNGLPPASVAGGAAGEMETSRRGCVWGGREQTLATLLADGSEAMAVDAKFCSMSRRHESGVRTALGGRIERGKPCPPRARRATAETGELHGAISKGSPRRDKRSRSVAQQRQAQRQHQRRAARAASAWERDLGAQLHGELSLD